MEFRLCLVSFLIGIFAAAAAEPKAWKTRNEFDFIVVGAGAAGAAVASRLSEDGRYKVALLEAGGEPAYVTQIPYMACGPFKGEHDWDYTSVKQKKSFLGFKVHTCPIPRGRGLGGSTLINAMMFTRANRRDYDNWASLGNDGWDYDSVLPFFRKMEDYQVPLLHESDRAFHNQGGPVTVSTSPYVTEVVDAFLEAGREVGLPEVDSNAGSQYGVTRPVFALRNGTRHSTNDAYLKHARNRPNLEIITHAFVTKITLNGKKRATGVIFEKDGSDWSLKAQKEVIVSGGSINSPQLLLLSGIGPKETLKKHEIPVVVDLPGVGQNLQDHVSTFALYFTFDSDAGFKANEITTEAMEMWERQRKGPLTAATRVEGLAFFNSNSNSERDWPDLEILTAQPPLPAADMDIEVIKAAFIPRDGKNTISFCPIVLRPKSRGYLTLKSANPHDHPLIEPRFFSHADDEKTIVDGIKMVFKFADTDAFKKLGLRYHGNKFPGCLHLEESTDEYWVCAAQHYTIVYFHPSGTCKMGPASDKMAVVDSRLRVRGVSGLRVSDVSISPQIVSGHTMVPAIMIGEKTAHMILEDWDNKHEEL